MLLPFRNVQNMSLNVINTELFSKAKPEYYMFLFLLYLFLMSQITDLSVAV